MSLHEVQYKFIGCKIHGEQRLSTNLKVFSINSFRFQQLEIYQRRSLAPIRYTACVLR